MNNSFRAISNCLHISLSAIVPNCPGDVSGVEARVSGVAQTSPTCVLVMTGELERWSGVARDNQLYLVVEIERR